MKYKSIILLILPMIIAVVLAGCNNSPVYTTEKEDSSFRVFYNQILGFADNDELYKTVPKDTILMMADEDYQKFMDEYFNARQLRIKSHNKENAVLYLQIPYKFSYKVEGVNTSKDTLTVNLKEDGRDEVSPVRSDLEFKRVIFIEIDKSILKDDMKIRVKIH